MFQVRKLLVCNKKQVFIITQIKAVNTLLYLDETGHKVAFEKMCMIPRGNN